MEFDSKLNQKEYIVYHMLFVSSGGEVENRVEKSFLDWKQITLQ